MSREECDELVRDLSAAGIEVVRVDELRDGSFTPYCRCLDPARGPIPA